MSRISVGDRVVVKTEGSILSSRLKRDYDLITCDIKKVYNSDVGKFEISNIQGEHPSLGQTVYESSIMKTNCCDCKSDLVYNQKKEKWFCPFCEEDA